MMNKLLAVLPILLVIFGCQQMANEASISYENQAMPVATEANKDMTYDAPYAKKVAAPSANGLRAAERKIIKHGNVKFQVEDLEKCTGTIEGLARDFGGYISNMNQNNTSHAIRNQLEVKIPSAHFGQFVAGILEASVYTDYKRIKTNDVSAEFYDISARLATKKEVRDRYASILRDKANSISEVLQTEEKIRVIQEEIEAIEGRLKFINTQTAMSSIQLEIYQEVTYMASPDLFHKSFSTKVYEGFDSGLSMIQTFVVALVAIWPLTFLVLVLLAFRKRIRWALKGYQVMK